ncbi:MAG: hypothetical protein ACYTKC_16165 [Planctomycetota bacterium]|jgi:hypothetical protein
MRPAVASLTILLFTAALPAQFLRPRNAAAAKLWGVENGIAVGVHPDLRGPLGGVCPRGLLRIGLLRDGKPQLFNFLAVEPLVGRRKGLSELERSQSDGKPGKLFSLANTRAARPRSDGGAVPGVLRTTKEGRTLTFVVHVERFANGAQPIVEITLFEKHPCRVRLRSFAAKGSAKIQQLTLSATMGNMVRARYLWLADEPVYALDLYRRYRGHGFVEHGTFGLDKLHRTADGAVVVAITPDEYDPSEAWPFANGGWRGPSGWLAQYWMKPKGTFDSSLACRVNGRRVYWRSRNPLPGGTAYENFELRETFRAGQEIWFGLAELSPSEALGFTYDVPPGKAVKRKIPADEQKRIVAVGREHQGLANGNFEKELRGWIAEPDPTPFRLFTEGEEQRLTTFGAGRDGDRGRLYQCFEVPKKAAYLRFFLHGGCDPRRLRVNLWNGEELLRWMTGRNHNGPIEIRFSLARVRGKVVTLEIVDQSTARWGFLGVHGFEVVTR